MATPLTHWLKHAFTEKLGLVPRQLMGMLSLALLFSLSSTAWARTISDRALFIVENNIFFASDLKAFEKELTFFSCMMKDSLLLGGVKLTPKRNSQNDKGQTEKIITLLKVLNYSRGQKVIIDESLEPSTLSNAAARGCRGGSKKWSFWVRNLMRAEILFRSRFSLKAFWVTEKELEGLKKRNPQVKQTQSLVKREKEKKRDDAMKIFLNSLRRQLEHSYF